MTQSGTWLYGPNKMYIYNDDDAACIIEDITPSMIISLISYIYPLQFFNYQEKPIVRRQILLGLKTINIFPLFLPELELYGVPY